jgi:hypothetical protein
MSQKRENHIHVIPHNGSWAVKEEGKNRITSIYDTQHEAEEAARNSARSLNGQLVIHSRDGRVRDRDSFSSNPKPPKSTRRILYPLSKSSIDRNILKKTVRDVINEKRK